MGQLLKSCSCNFIIFKNPFNQNCSKILMIYIVSWKCPNNKIRSCVSHHFIIQVNVKDSHTTNPVGVFPFLVSWFIGSPVESVAPWQRALNVCFTYIVWITSNIILLNKKLFQFTDVTQKDTNSQLPFTSCLFVVISC